MTRTERKLLVTLAHAVIRLLVGDSIGNYEIENMKIKECLKDMAAEDLRRGDPLS